MSQSGHPVGSLLLHLPLNLQTLGKTFLQRVHGGERRIKFSDSGSIKVSTLQIVSGDTGTDGGNTVSFPFQHPPSVPGGYRVAYNQEICDRCEALIRRQMRHYGYLVK